MIQDDPTPQAVHSLQALVAPVEAQAKSLVTISGHSQGRWTLFEYGGTPRSNLVQWFRQHGHRYCQVGVNPSDLSCLKLVQDTEHAIKMELMKGQQVVVWIHLPREPWSTFWKNRWSEGTRQRREERCAQARLALDLLSKNDCTNAADFQCGMFDRCDELANEMPRMAGYRDQDIV